jgi:hypothetical protein
MVTGRKPSLWLRVVAVLTSLVALWAFAAYVTVGEGVSLAWLAILETRVGKPTEALVAALQEERRLSVEFGATGVLSGRSTLDNARRATDAAIDRQRKGMESLLGRWSTSKVSDDRLGDLLKGLETLPSQRSLLDAGRMGRTTAAQYFTDLIQLGSDVYESYLALDDRDILYSANTILLLTQGQEIMSREDALMAGVIGANVFEAADRNHSQNSLAHNGSSPGRSPSACPSRIATTTPRRSAARRCRRCGFWRPRSRWRRPGVRPPR